MLRVEIRSFQEEDFKETFISLAEVFKGDGVLFGRENAELEVRTGVPARSVPIDRSLISRLAESSEYLPYISKGSFLVLQKFLPGSFSGLVQVCGLSHGTGTWKGNAEDILGSVCDQTLF